MKLLVVIAALLALSQAKQFIQKDNDTICIMLDVTGTFKYTPDNNSTRAVSLDLTKATVLNESSCQTLKLMLEKEAQVWFDFKSSTADDQMVSLVTAFVPKTIFDDASISNETVIFTSSASFKSPKNESYLCKSEVTTTLQTAKMPADVNVTVEAMLKDFQVQSSAISAGKYSKATECKQDVTTPIPSKNTTATTPAPITTTMKPSPKAPVNSYGVKTGNVTCLNVTGAISFSIQYETKDKKMVTTDVAIPKDFNTVGSNCSFDKSVESLVINFFNETWKASLFFTKMEDNFFISNISLAFVYDKHLPNAMRSGTTETAEYGSESDKFRKASTKGYYTCSSNTTQMLNKNVTMATKDFKYKAFNDKGSIKFSGDNVSECSQDEESDSIVPIAVGAALAGLVVIVLIAYLIGRRRSKKTGYESV